MHDVSRGCPLILQDPSAGEKREIFVSRRNELLVDANLLQLPQFVGIEPKQQAAAECVTRGLGMRCADHLIAREVRFLARVPGNTDQVA